MFNIRYSSHYFLIHREKFVLSSNNSDSSHSMPKSVAVSTRCLRHRTSAEEEIVV